MPGTKIAPCECKHAFQDKEYGVGNRVHNHAPKKDTEKTRYRCTVCGKTRDIN